MMKSAKLLARIIFVLLCCFSFYELKAAKLTGLILDENNQPLPFVIVYVSGTSVGTTANPEGYYSLELQKGAYDISFRLIGYTLLTKKVTIDNISVELNVKMINESIKLKEVNISANTEDPAYAIIRAAQAKRKFYLDQVKLYKTHAYVKSTQRLSSHPKKVMGQEVDLGDEVDSVTGIFYLSESVSELSFKDPKNFKEIMISSKVSGSPKTYSFNQSTDVLISFYESLVNIVGLTPRGIVSPIAGNSFFYYKFRHEGTFSENGVLINKISVIPKRRYDPVFTGTIYIAEDTWRLYSVDLQITREQQMEFIDTFRVKQNFLRVNDEVWMPFNSRFDYSFDFMGFKGGGTVLGIFSDYNLNPKFNKTFFNGEILSVDESANKKDSSYWEGTRPVPLTGDESNDYRKRDSSRVIHESKTYLDSMDRKSNKFEFSNILTGYSWQNSYKRTDFSIDMPFTKISFSTVEGWNSGLGFSYNKKKENDDPRKYTISTSLRYGLSNRHFNGTIAYNNFYNAKKHSVLRLEGGTDIAQFNSKNPISELVNFIYSVWAEKNYMKIYEKQYILASHNSELINGIFYKLSAEYAGRNSLSNTTDYKFTDTKGREYTSNDPYHPLTDSLRFATHQALIIEAGISYKPAQKYISRPEAKYNLGSDWPVLRFNYKKGIEAAGSDVNFDAIQFSLDDEISLGLFGRLKYMGVYGDFLSKKKLYAPDLKHFNGNKTWVSEFRINDFKNLDYYAYSTTGKYLEIHAEENFGGFFLNKLPFIRKLKLREIASVHFLHTAAHDRYFEVSAGLEKLGFIRAELFTSFLNGQKGTVGFLFGIKTVLRN